MGRYKKMWILLHEKIAGRAVKSDHPDDERFLEEHEFYAGVSALMTELQADMLTEEDKR